MDTQHKIARLIGQITGVVLVGCIAACGCALLIGLTVKFLGWIF